MVFGMIWGTASAGKSRRPSRPRAALSTEAMGGWTPAMQAGLVSKRLTFRHVFTSVPDAAILAVVVLALAVRPAICAR